MEVLYLQPDRSQARAYLNGARSHYGHDDPGDERQLPVGGRHEDEHDDEKNCQGQQAQHAKVDEHAHRFHVLGGAGHELARLRLVVVGEAQPLEVVVDLIAEIIGDP